MLEGFIVQCINGNAISGIQAVFLIQSPGSDMAGNEKLCLLNAGNAASIVVCSQDALPEEALIDPRLNQLFPFLCLPVQFS